MTNIYNTITQISVGQKDDSPIFGHGIRIKLDDDCAGMFLVFEQDDTNNNANQIRISFEEWDNVILAVSVLKNQPLVK
jgi:hypothetical protein